MAGDPILDLIMDAIPVDPDDGTTIVGTHVHDGNPCPRWGHPVTVAALIRDRLVEAGLLPPPGATVPTSSAVPGTIMRAVGPFPDRPAGGV